MHSLRSKVTLSTWFCVVFCFVIGLIYISSTNLLVKKPKITSTENTNNLSNLDLLCSQATTEFNGQLQELDFLRPPARPIVLKRFDKVSSFFEGYPAFTADAIIFDSEVKKYRLIHWERGKVISNKYMNRNEAKVRWEKALSRMPAWMFIVGQYKNQIKKNSAPDMDRDTALVLQKEYYSFVEAGGREKYPEFFDGGIYRENFPPAKDATR